MREFLNSPNFTYTLIVLISLISAVVLSNIIRNILNRILRKKNKDMNIDHTKYNFFKNAISFMIYTAAIVIVFYSIPALRAIGLTLFAGAGIITAVLAFASQQAISNIISGIFIVIFRPFRVNDIIKVGNHEIGTVEDITLRHTIVRSFENKRIIIPNSIINSETIVNSTDEESAICNFLDFNLNFQVDVEKVRNILSTQALLHKYCIDNRTEEEKDMLLPIVEVKVIGFTESAINIRAYIWTKNSREGFELKCDLRESVKKEFDQQGIELAYPHQVVIKKNS